MLVKTPTSAKNFLTSVLEMKIMEDDKIINLILEELKEFVLKYIDCNISDNDLTVTPNKHNLFDIRCNGFNQFYCIYVLNDQMSCLGSSFFGFLR
jgi:hypothetical protein